jgi:prepilin-type N-terminal cleavage/methylation domain-containing protein
MSQRTRTLRPGFTLFELLVVLALLVLLFGLLLPAIFQARKSASRILCRNNMKQISLATINAADTYGGKLAPLAGYYPQAPTQPGTPATHGSIFFHILPFLEQDNLYKSGADDKGTSFSAWRGGVYSKFIPTYVCPSDGSSPTHLYEGWLATGSYAANFLVFGANTTYTMDGTARFPASITDGTSNTIFFSERSQQCGGAPNAWAYDGQSSWTPAFAYASVGKFQVLPAERQCDPNLAQSPHAGGINAALGDSSVRFVSDKVSPRTWWFACTPAGGEVLGPDW